MPTTAAVIGTAREYVDTRFHHQGRAKGKNGGLDCVGLVLCVAEDLGIKDVQGVEFKRGDYPDYSPQPVGRFVHEECRRRLVLKSVKDMKPGDVVTMRIPTDPCHAAIISEHGGVLYMIHAYQGTERCVEHVLSHQWRNRIVGVFSFPEVSD
jgi:cell wall-associated NlpC family hydrolase